MHLLRISALCLALAFAPAAQASDHPAPEAGHGAAAEGGHGEKKAKPSEKPKPDSAISMVMQLPVVKKWKAWLDGKGEGEFAIWGETVKEVQGGKCWSVAVGEESATRTRVWRRFCVQQTGLEIWVESLPGTAYEDITYSTYDSWSKSCAPTENTPGKC